MPAANSVSKTRQGASLQRAIQTSQDDEGHFVFGLPFFVQPRFGIFMKSWRSRLKMSLRQAAKDSGVPFATWARAENGDDVRLSTVVEIIAWAINREICDGTAPEEVVRHEDGTPFGAAT